MIKCQALFFVKNKIKKYFGMSTAAEKIDWHFKDYLYSPLTPCEESGIGL